MESGAINFLKTALGLYLNKMEHNKKNWKIISISYKLSGLGDPEFGFVINLETANMEEVDCECARQWVIINNEEYYFN